MIVYEHQTKKFRLRTTDQTDVSLILSYIRKLAIYEKLEHVMKATESSLETSLFKEHRAEVIIAEYEEKPIGFALFFHNYSTFLGKANLYLEDLFIDPEYRHRGFGRMIFTYLAHLALERRRERFDWMCLNWNEPSIQFYKRLGAKPLADWITFRLDHEALIHLTQ